jgi:beta-N-acetylhexosaminidase
MGKVKSIAGILAVFAFCVSCYGLTYTDKVDIGKLFDGAVKDKAFPGGVVAAGSSKETFIVQGYGYHTYKQNVKDTADTIFDMASCSKVCATTPAIMKLYDEGKIKITDKIIKYLPEIINDEKNPLQKKLKSEITIKNLLTHTSGFPPDNDVYKMRKASVKERWSSLLKTPLAYYPGKKYMYSDVNMLMLQQIVQKVSGMDLNSFLQKNIYKPLGMNHTGYNPPKEYLNDIAPTEFDIYTNKPFHGVVHDENARSLAGLAGHAGLFSTAKDLSIYAKMLLNYGEYNGVRIFKPETVKLFIKRANVIPGNSRALGWDTVYNTENVIPKADREENNFILDKTNLYEKNYSYGGLYIDPDAICHTGYTGTTFYISFKDNVFVILLTNRVFPFRNYTPYNVYQYWAQKINSSVWENLGFTKKNEIVEYPKPNFYHKAD